METKKEKTTITLYKETKELLDSVGKKGMTYDEIISELCKEKKNEN